MCVLLKEGTIFNQFRDFLRCNWQRKRERGAPQNTNTTGCLGREDAIDRSISQPQTWNLLTSWIISQFPAYSSSLKPVYVVKLDIATVG